MQGFFEKLRPNWTDGFNSFEVSSEESLIVNPQISIDLRPYKISFIFSQIPFFLFYFLGIPFLSIISFGNLLLYYQKLCF